MRHGPQEGANALKKTFDIRLREGLNALDGGNPAAALETLKGLEREGVETPDLLEGIGRACMRGGDAAGAVDHFRRALDANPNLLASRIGLGLCLLELGRTSEGAETLKRAIDRGRGADGLSPEARGRLVKEHVRLGETYSELGRAMEAVREYERAIRLGGDYPDIRRKMASEYRRLGLLADAERQLRRALHRNPGYDEARADLGYLYLHSGRSDLAAEEWSQVRPDGRGGGLVAAYRQEADPDEATDPQDPPGG